MEASSESDACDDVTPRDNDNYVDATHDDDQINIKLNDRDVY